MRLFNRFRSNSVAPRTILIVDDEPNIVRTVGDRLKMSGYQVITAGDGEEGVSRAVQYQPDLILLDVAMPVLDGLDALKRLRHMEETKSVPVIMLTARSSADDVTRAVLTGAADYMVKPFDFVELIEKIEGALSTGSRA